MVDLVGKFLQKKNTISGNIDELFVGSEEWSGNRLEGLVPGNAICKNTLRIFQSLVISFNCHGDLINHEFDHTNGEKMHSLYQKE